MGESFEKATNTALGAAKSGTAIAIRLIAQKLDEMNEENVQRHSALIKTITADKNESCEKCKECKEEVDAKFSKLKPILFLMEYPLWAAVSVFGLVIYGLFKFKIL